jgi:hypothetical protein
MTEGVEGQHLQRYLKETLRIFPKVISKKCHANCLLNMFLYICPLLFLLKTGFLFLTFLYVMLFFLTFNLVHLLLTLASPTFL